MSKKQLIMETAIELFAKNGIEATSVQHITASCGISKGAFYLAFKSKDELLLSIIDYFMQEIVNQLDRVVRSSIKPEEKLYQYYYLSFVSFTQHSSFAKMYVREQMHTFNEELFEKMSQYDAMMSRSTLAMIDELYGDRADLARYDLLLCMKSFVQSYSQFLLLCSGPHDISLLAKSLAEKTDVLAHHSVSAYVTKDMLKNIIHTNEVKHDLDTIRQELEEMAQEEADPLYRDSLLLLKEELASGTPRPAVIKGLTGNLQDKSTYSWIIYLIFQHTKV